MRAIIEVDVPDHQIGQEASIYFKDTMMIKGIVQESSDDAISKQAVLDLIEHYKDMKEIAEIMKCDADAETKCKMISEIVNGIPHYFKEQEPKTGHWIDDNGIYAWCSCCKEHIYQTGEFKYCPNCGARMAESEGEDISSGNITKTLQDVAKIVN